MNIDAELELKYFKIIEKRSSKWTPEDMEHVEKREKSIYEQFELNESNVKKLELLNSKLLVQEERIFPFYKKIMFANTKLVTDGVIDDFNIDIIITCFRNKYYEKLFPESENDFAYETNCNFMLRQDFKYYNEDDWKEEHLIALSHFKHCYSFHHLYDHTNLLLFDLCQIDDVWIDLKIDYQFFFSI